jgi:hypothetical protein
LSLDFKGKRRNLAGQFVGNDFMRGYFAAVKILESFALAGFQAACLPV